MDVNKCAIEKEVMEVTLACNLKESHGSDVEARPSNSNLLVVNYRPQKFLGLLAPTQYASVTRLSPTPHPPPPAAFSCEHLA